MMIRGDDDNAVDDDGGAVPCGAVLFCAVLQNRASRSMYSQGSAVL